MTVDGSGRVKPDIAAPGVAVWSAFPGDSYAEFDGTSMAGPHVAGVVALMWSANPALIGDIERTETILRETARPFSGEMANLDAVLADETEAAADGSDAVLQRLDDLMLGGNTCIVQSDTTQTPNNLVGYGIVDAYAAVRAAVESPSAWPFPGMPEK